MEGGRGGREREGWREGGSGRDGVREGDGGRRTVYNSRRVPVKCNTPSWSSQCHQLISTHSPDIVFIEVCNIVIFC